ncbi:MAG TPA: peptidyl-tRNA hydrolase Pth2 [Ktedonobacterales bacterium]|nr:peptidyl-tRNA hydrolase Pth2 [Ktedonobacterales bacterium]
MKQVIVVNRSLMLPMGKLAAQVAHAAVSAFLVALPDAQRLWLSAGMPKIVLQVEDEAALLQLERQAQSAGLPHYLIRDAGKTVLPSGTITCLGIGPASAEQIDAITGSFPLL